MTVFVAMIAVGLAEMAGDAVIYVLTVWHGLVAATGAVHMAASRPL